MPHDTSIRGMTIEDCRLLAMVMGYSETALDHYAGRYIRIKIRGIRYRGEKFTIGHMPVGCDISKCPFKCVKDEIDRAGQKDN